MLRFRLDQLMSIKVFYHYFTKIMKAIPLKLWVINGQEPERVGELMSKGRTRGTCLLRYNLEYVVPDLWNP